VNQDPSGQAPAQPPPPDDPGVDLPTLLARGMLRVLQRRVVAVLLAATGLTLGLLILTLGSVAAAWDTPYRWLVLLGVGALYLLLGGIGVWQLRQPVEDPDLEVVRERLADTQLRVRQFVARMGGNADAEPTLAGIHPRSRTLRWVAASLGNSPMPWVGLLRLLFRWYTSRRR
jgi:hypothetical protein